MGLVGGVRRHRGRAGSWPADGCVERRTSRPAPPARGGSEAAGQSQAIGGRHDALFHRYLWRLNIGAGYQGKGYGRFAVEAVCQEAARRGKRRLTVCYHPYQHGPEGFYRRLGFRPTGEYHQDEVMAERILSPDRA